MPFLSLCLNIIDCAKYHCPSTRTFPRMIDGPDITFDMEPKLPRLQNIAGHAADCKGKKDESMQDGPTSEERFNVMRSTEKNKSRSNRVYTDYNTVY